ncbi:DUF397 domain-containing protein [Amycolatopsis alkalitolerans]|uniref:DUF397 domain-containing protein n=1 Tax=Amycolatopsis alkalitolerans TaxID=2547244 RepID=A0A5C4LYH1_9PSEU|nr:DUF397 domain-containing protein [Amycolatopsis alkalitolerans]TNC23407.1 DUF397 domain-containing protein [Amycolatopsis alkalitolerans]
MNDHVRVDDKADVRDALDLESARWQRAEPAGESIPDAVEFAFIPHTDGRTYTALRSSTEPQGTVLVFTESEWDAFVAGARDGEFNLPES